jgi:hypothetical protein
MAIVINVKHDIKKLTEHLTWLQKEQIPYATAVAINACLAQIKPAVQAEMLDVFDKPTPYTLNSYMVMKGAKKNSLFGIVGFKTQRIFNEAGKFTGGFTTADEEKSNPRLASTYLQPQMRGGIRPAKGLELLLRARGILGNNEFLVPSKFMKLDQYGNVSRGTVQKILANLQATRDPYSRTPSGGARGGKKKAEFFFTRKGVRGQRHTMIWQTFGRKGKHNAVPAFIVVSAAPQYRKRFDQQVVVERVVAMRFPAEFDSAMIKALATAR